MNTGSSNITPKPSSRSAVKLKYSRARTWMLYCSASKVSRKSRMFGSAMK